MVQHLLHIQNLVTPEIWYNTRRFRRSVSPLGASGPGFGSFQPPPLQSAEREKSASSRWMSPSCRIGGLVCRDLGHSVHLVPEVSYYQRLLASLDDLPVAVRIADVADVAEAVVNRLDRPRPSGETFDSLRLELHHPPRRRPHPLLPPRIRNRRHPRRSCRHLKYDTITTWEIAAFCHFLRFETLPTL